MKFYIIVAYKTAITLYSILFVFGLVKTLIVGNHLFDFNDPDGNHVKLTMIYKLKLMIFNPMVVGICTGCRINDYIFEYDDEEE